VRPAHGEPDSKAAALSVRLFQRLLAAYPKEHRREYGPAMAQLFRDQCRDAWRDRRGWGLTGLWLRVLPDLVKTSVLEHISTLKKRKTMLERTGTLLLRPSGPQHVFIVVFAVVFLLAVATSTLITFIMPESYSSTVRIRPGWTVGDRAGQLEFESIQSVAVLSKVVDNLHLNQAWGRKYAGGSLLKPSESLKLLKARIEVRPVRGTELIEIRAFSDDAAEAAKLANAIAVTYCDYRSSTFSIEIVDRAVPGVRPARPNKPVNIALGVLGGMLLALVVGAGMAGIVVWLGRRSLRTGTPPAMPSVPPPELPPSNLPRADGWRARNTLVKVTGILWMGIGGALSALALVALVWILIFQQVRVTDELLILPVFGLVWGCNAFLGFFLLRERSWARICLGVEGALLLTHYFFRQGFASPQVPAWVDMTIIRLGWFLVGPIPYIPRWVFVPLGLASVCAFLWPRKATSPNPC
jgi:capsular polysaccharide biosynthesis protein